MYTIIVTSKEVCNGRFTMTQEGARFWVMKDLTGFIEATSTPVKYPFQTPARVPINAQTWETEEEAIEFGKRWQGHPWWCRPISFEVVKLHPLSTGWLVKGTL